MELAFNCYLLQLYAVYTLNSYLLFVVVVILSKIFKLPVNNTSLKLIVLDLTITRPIIKEKLELANSRSFPVTRLFSESVVCSL